MEHTLRIRVINEPGGLTRGIYAYITYTCVGTPRETDRRGQQRTPVARGLRLTGMYASVYRYGVVLVVCLYV